MTGSTMSDLVVAWQACEQAPSNRQRIIEFHAAVEAFAAERDMKPLVVQSEMARLRRRRPRPDHAAVLTAITEGTAS